MISKIVEDALKTLNVKNLKNISKEKFLKTHETYKKKREYSLSHKSSDWLDMFVYQWNDFDFIEGKLMDPTKTRMPNILSHFMENHKIFIEKEKNFWRGKSVLIIGSHCGMGPLIIHTLGASCITCVEEHKDLVLVNEFMCNSFNKYCSIMKNSLYNIPSILHKNYDIILFSGVLYHLSDPFRSLRILYNQLNDNGLMLLETYILKGGGRRTVQYMGPNSPGWDWFVPSEKCCDQMCMDAGFDYVYPLGRHTYLRYCLAAKKKKHKLMPMYAGVANSDELRR